VSATLYRICHNCHAIYDWTQHNPFYCSQRCADRRRAVLEESPVCSDFARYQRSIRQELAAWDSRLAEPMNVRRNEYLRPAGWR